MGIANTDQPLVVVFHAEDPELLPLAEGALEQEGIEYLIRRAGSGVPVGFGQPAEFGGADRPSDVLVHADDAARARAVLADLALNPDAPVSRPTSPSPPAAAPRAAGPHACRLTEADSGAFIGEITEPQLQCLVDELEEESETDRNYYIDAATIDVLEAAGADAELVTLLRHALGTREGIEIAWEKLNG
jgi:putative signal transducing protein